MALFYVKTIDGVTKYSDVQVDSSWGEMRTPIGISINNWVPNSQSVHIKLDGAMFVGGNLTAILSISDCDLTGFYIDKPLPFSQNRVVFNRCKMPIGFNMSTEISNIGGSIGSTDLVLEGNFPNLRNLWLYGTPANIIAPSLDRITAGSCESVIIKNSILTSVHIGSCKSVSLEINSYRETLMEGSGNIENLTIEGVCMIKMLNFSALVSKFTTGSSVLFTTISLKKSPITSFTGNFIGTDLNNAFQDCTQLKTVSLNILKPVTKWYSTFSGCINLEKIYMNNPKPSGSGDNTFLNCSKLVGGKGTKYDSTHTNYTYAKNDNSTPGYFNAISDSEITLNVYDEIIDKTSSYIINRYYLIYDLYSQICKVEFASPFGYNIDYWAYFNGTNWVNIGTSNKLNYNDYKPGNWIVPIIKRGGGEGFATVDLSQVPSNSCTLTGAGTYKVGDNVVITVKAKEGFIFSHWEEQIGTNFVKLSEEETYTIKAIGRNMKIRAVCIKMTPENTVKVNLVSDGNGEVIGAGTYLKGKNVVISAKPNKGFVFQVWAYSNNPADTAATKATTTIQNIQKDMTFYAFFAKDPYGGGSSGPGGGNGSFDETSDKTDNNSSNSLDALALNTATTIYLPDDAQLQAFFNYLYGDTFEGLWKAFIDKISSVGGSPLDYLLQLYLIPAEVTPTGTRPITLGWVDSTLQTNYTTKRYVTVDLGSINLQPYWNNALDYKSQIEIYLPYIGFQSLDTVEVMGKTLKLDYRIDLTNGDCIALITANGNTLYEFNGNCAYKIPLSQQNWTDVIGSIMSAGVNMATKSWSGVVEAVNEGGANAVTRSGNLQSNIGSLSVQKPYLIITRPKLSMPANYGHYYGYPSNITARLGSLTGYTKVKDIHLEGIPCTETELLEIEQLLKEGVIL